MVGVTVPAPIVAMESEPARFEAMIRRLKPPLGASGDVP
jgi:hypothetical protein